MSSLTEKPWPPRSGHDYAALLQRWREGAAALGLREKLLGEVAGFPVVMLENTLSAAGEPGGLYVSAGVHGDECAPVWGLLEWAESHPRILAEKPVMLFPCLNPYGLVANTRLDGDGRDMNRSFTDGTHPLVAARGEALLAACEGILPREEAEEIDGTPFLRGLQTLSADIENVVAEHLGGGYPEAILLFLRHAGISYTFETPSERDFSLRVAAQRAFLEAVAGDLTLED